VTVALTSRERVLRTVSEESFLGQVLEYARLFGWRCFHARPAETARGVRTAVQGDGVGFPDLVLVHPHHGVLVAELKREAGKLKPEQERWIADFRAAGVAAYVWRPSDWSRITQILSGGPAAPA
jgi:hypothetical protein